MTIFSIIFSPSDWNKRSTLTERTIKNTLTGLRIGILNYFFFPLFVSVVYRRVCRPPLLCAADIWKGKSRSVLHTLVHQRSILMLLFYLSLRHPICLFIYDFPTIILKSYASLIFPLLFNPPSFIIYLMMMYNSRWKVNSRKLIILQLFPLFNPSVTEPCIPVSLRYGHLTSNCHYSIAVQTQYLVSLDSPPIEGNCLSRAYKPGCRD
jgi:hypothetical protein